MTEGRVSQGGGEFLHRVNPDGQVSQSGAEYLHRVQPGTKASQAGAEYLHRVEPSFAVSQAGVEYLYKSSPCTTRWAQFWTITRADGEVFRFTSLDVDFTLEGNEYKACDSLVPSASQAVSEVDAAGSMDLSGAIGPDGITELALYAGLFDGAEVEAWLLPWSGDGPRRLLMAGTFGPIEQTPTGFKIELQGDGQKLMQTPLVRTLQPGCRWQFGSVECGKDLGPITVTGTVDSGSGVRDFTDAARAEAAGYFTGGKVTFTSGDNDGISAEIKLHSSGGVFELWPRLPFAISAGDTYSMVPGCTYLKAAVGGTNGCTAWGRLVSYGGFPSVPTKDKLTAAAEVKDPE